MKYLIARINAGLTICGSCLFTMKKVFNKHLPVFVVILKTSVVLKNPMTTISRVKNKYSDSRGFSFIEGLIGVAVFSLVSYSVFGGYSKIIEAVGESRVKIAAVNLANEQLEIIKNMPYENIGIVGGVPQGNIPYEKNVSRDGTPFVVRTYVSNVDDSFDGTIGGDPEDTSPSDYKSVDIEVLCPSCKNYLPINISTLQSPKNLDDSNSSNGALLIKVYNANGQPVSGASVNIINTKVSPAININNTTNESGIFEVIGVPVGSEAYQITVTKSGYSTERTYSSRDFSGSSPVKPNATVSSGKITQLSFYIDELSSLNISTVTKTCALVSSVGFNIASSKLIATSPAQLKYLQSFTTDTNGNKNVSELEWDSYNISLNGSTYSLAGSIPFSPVSLDPSSDLDLKIIVEQNIPKSLLVTVKDSGTGLPISGATVNLVKSGVDISMTTGRGFLRQTDWSLGGGQANYVDLLKYWSSDGNIETSSPTGELKIKKIFSDYVPSGELISSTFDTGMQSNFYDLSWLPKDQPSQAGNNSVRFQIATNNDNETWNYVGPDGTSATYYTNATSSINPVHNNSRYFRYKVLLSTESDNSTPNISEVAFTFSSSCVPSGQVLFSGSSQGNYSIMVTKDGYQTFLGTVNISNDFQEKIITLTPQ